MKVLSLIDSFKGTISSKDLGRIMTKILRRKNIDAYYMPISDGGEGLLDVICHIKNTKKVYCNAIDPLGRKIKTYYLYNKKENTAYIEMAKSSGLMLIEKEKQNPLIANTYGLGLLIYNAIKKGIKHIIIGIGGSATNDVGVGMLNALGVKFYNHESNIMKEVNNNTLKQIKTIDLNIFNETIKNINFTVLSDVQNPLLGENGATYTYAKQKGAKEEELPILESNIKYFADLVKARLNIDDINFPGGGAAGGVGFAFKVFFNPDFKSGINYILDEIDFDNSSYDILITGEGKIDNQTMQGKVISGILSRVKNKEIILVCGINELKNEKNIPKIYSIVDEISTIEYSLKYPIKAYKKLCEKVSNDIIK
ncbi:MAG TPA: glycerate kinase [Acholeplasmataceae bacterium]|nr:glycerate kinase [Acholeplasmataceae bacterium]